MSTIGSKAISMAPPPLAPFNTKADNMIRELEYWKRFSKIYCRIAKVTDKVMLDVFFAYVGRDTGNFMRDLPNFYALKLVDNLIEKVSNCYC